MASGADETAKGGNKMLNQVVLVGRLVTDLNKVETSNDETKIRLAIGRNFKNNDAKYETDFIECVIGKGLEENLKTLCKKGSVVGVKGRLEERQFIQEGHPIFTYSQMVAEKISFISGMKE